MQRLRAVIFDLDGLLLDTERLACDAWMFAMQEHGLELPEVFFHALVGCDDVEVRERIAVRCAGTPFSSLSAACTRHWNRLLEERGRHLMKSGIAELLELLASAGIRTAIATSTDRATVDQYFGHVPLESAFDVMATGDEVLRRKPAPDLYDLAVSRLGIAASEIVALEDSEAGVIAARDAGVRSILVPDLQPPSKAAVAEAFAVVSSLTEARRILEDLMRGAPAAFRNSKQSRS